MLTNQEYIELWEELEDLEMPVYISNNIATKKEDS